MALPNYSYQIVDLITKAILAEVSMSGVTYSKLLNDTSTFTGTLSIDAKLALKGYDYYDLTTPVRRCIYVLRDGAPMWGGIIWTRKYDSTTQKIAIGAADWWSYFDRRKIVLTGLGIADTIGSAFFVANLLKTYTGVDQNVLARTLVSDAAIQYISVANKDIGITFDTGTSGITRDRTYQGFDLENIGDTLRKLSQVNGGPDIRFDVGLSSTGDVNRLMLVGIPLLGIQGSTNVWEYKGNIQSYTWPSDGTKMATRMLAIGNGTGSSMPIATWHDLSRYPFGWPILDGESGYTTDADTVSLAAHAVADQAASRVPVALPELIVRADLPPLLGSYSPGDDARVIIQDAFLVNGIDTTMRIVKIQVAPPENNAEQVILTMAPLLDDVTY